jgi:hypothetical protein
MWRYLRLFSHCRLPLQVRSSVHLISALVLTPSPAAPAPAGPHGLIGYEPQSSGVLGDKQPTHFTIEEILRIPSSSYCSLEPGKLAKRFASYHLCPTRTLLALVGSFLVALRVPDTARPCHALWTLVRSVSWPTFDAHSAADLFAPLAAFVGSLLVALRPPHPASRTFGCFWPLRSRHVALQFGNTSAPLPNQPQFGTVSTAARPCKAAARPPPLLALLPRSPSTPPTWTTRRSSPSVSSGRQTSQHGAPPWRHASASWASSASSLASAQSLRHLTTSSPSPPPGPPPRPLPQSLSRER